MFKSNFGVTGCLPWKERDNGVTTGGCTLETRFDSMGLVSIGGCQNSDTGGPGYVNISGGCCINDPPPECITKSTGTTGIQTGTTVTTGKTGFPVCDTYQNYGNGTTDCNKKIYNTQIGCVTCQQTDELYGRYTPPPTIFNKPFPQYTGPSNNYGELSGARPYNRSGEERVLEPIFLPPPPTLAKRQKPPPPPPRPRPPPPPPRPRPPPPPPPPRVKKGKSRFGIKGVSNLVLIIVGLICLLLFYLYKKKKLPGMRSFGKRRR